MVPPAASQEAANVQAEATLASTNRVASPLWRSAAIDLHHSLTLALVVHSERLLFVHPCLQLYTPKDYCYFTSAYSCTLRETTVIPPLPPVVHSERLLLLHLCLQLYTPRDYCSPTSWNPLPTRTMSIFCTPSIDWLVCINLKTNELKNHSH